MTRSIHVFIALAALTMPAIASASLVTFQVDALMDFMCAPCLHFEEDTGLSFDERPFDVTARFTIDTTATSTPHFHGDIYTFNQPLSVTVGQLTYTYPIFSLFINSTVCDEIYIMSGASASFEGTVFNTNNCFDKPTLPDHSLSSFVAYDMSNFFGTSFDSFTSNAARGRADQSWFLAGHVRRVVRVPEPQSLLLAAIGLSLLGFALWRRPRLS